MPAPLTPRPATALLRLAAHGVLSGLAGTAVMTVGAELEKRMRPGHDGPVDYDASRFVVVATATVLHVHPTTHAQRQALFLLTHWGYGSAVALAHEGLRTRLPERISAPVFYAGCQTMAFALFPTLGGTPPPWKWDRGLLASSLALHGAYVAAVATTSKWLRSRRPPG